MADLKISQLTAISVLTPATDVLPVVDVGGVTKKITTNQILASGGVASLASATITGAATVGTTLGVTGVSTLASAVITGGLTVDTSTLVVDATNDVVGIGTTTPNSYAFNDPAKLVIANTGTAGAGNTFTIASGSTGFGQIAFANGTSGTDRSNGYIKYSHSTNAMEFYTNAGTLQATLNSTGLGIGVSPSQRLHVKLDQNAYTYSRIDNQNASSGAYAALMLSASGNSWGIGVGSAAANSNALDFSIDALATNSVKMRLDSSGNLGIGVSTFGTSAANVLSIGTGTEPTTGPAGSVQFFTSTRSASNTIPAIFTEGSGVTNAAITNTTVTNKIAIKVNGTIYYLLATTSAA